MPKMNINNGGRKRFERGERVRILELDGQISGGLFGATSP